MPTPHYGQPRYRAIADELRNRIEGGIIPPGTLLPAESKLTAEFRASRGTIRQAIAILREEGLTATEHGRGTYVKTDMRSSSAHRQTGSDVQQSIISADAYLAALFQVDMGAEIIETEVISRTADKVVSVTRTYRLPR
ncbi:GntR family transcriptional regulator [Verrucosispora sp. WMMA2121]|uniref:GntR family transcriptional regulator n=1 Tax=Verrucosispora sp. WMMA2121 TaxID=3015164 RepID=UPI003FCE6826